MSAPDASLRSSRGIARYATALCALAAIAAVVAFVNGSWLGIVWVLLGGLASNMAWYYGRRARSGVSSPKAGEAAAQPGHRAASAE
ncbi:hypothetical protein DB35_17240 [Streptomyces abyssalis]|uniref:Uncharacterized protein n=1 Tax=Streptomyces abyssalis TaxID=933944 RepID=A0A1E7JKI1_9ACTN|nr:hypothetical protein [Streptomyces abyssalis]OEU88146.1 hypothetical protein AN215_18410 [Streptomyces abyssalis]OEU91017.1 hypothetical protein DB35_17240 [Streptomyces abyssalis]OEV28794.1 hypothetical protein AN219_19910 [Streptomyces nanshensis]